MQTNMKVIKMEFNTEGQFPVLNLTQKKSQMQVESTTNTFNFIDKQRQAAQQLMKVIKKYGEIGSMGEQLDEQKKLMLQKIIQYYIVSHSKNNNQVNLVKKSSCINNISRINYSSSCSNFNQISSGNNSINKNGRETQNYLDKGTKNAQYVQNQRKLKQSIQKLSRKLSQALNFIEHIKLKLSKKQTQLQNKQQQILNLKKQCQKWKERMRKQKVLKQIGQSSGQIMKNFQLFSKIYQKPLQLFCNFEDTVPSKNKNLQNYNKCQNVFYRTLYQCEQQTENYEKRPNSEDAQNKCIAFKSICNTGNVYLSKTTDFNDINGYKINSETASDKIRKTKRSMRRTFDKIVKCLDEDKNDKKLNKTTADKFSNNQKQNIQNNKNSNNGLIIMQKQLSKVQNKKPK